MKAKWVDNIGHYMAQIFPQKKAHMRHLMKEGQNPHTILLTCSDSRILSEQILGSKPGEVFVIRNPGNFIPKGLDASSEKAALAFALFSFDIKSILILGHSECGAMKGILNLDSDMPFELKSWLKLAPCQTPQGVYGFKNDLSLVNQLCLSNLVTQIKLLQKDDLIRQCNKPSLKIDACYFQMAEGQIFLFNPQTEKFQLL